MKKNIGIFVIPILVSSLYACDIGLSGNSRVNPTPIPTTTTIEKQTKFDIPSTNLSDELPEPSKTPEQKIEDFTFKLEIKFDGILGRAYIDDGDLMDTPVTTSVKGGTHTIIVFDLITKCRIAKQYYIDKNTVLDFTGKNSCLNDSNAGDADAAPTPESTPVSSITPTPSVSPIS